MVKEKKQVEKVVKTLRTTQDFTELLNLAELKTQMEVLGFLQDNLYEYQMNYFKSQLMSFDEVWDYISDNDKPKYFDHREYYMGSYDQKLKKWVKPKEMEGVNYLPYSEKYVREPFLAKPNCYENPNKLPKAKKDFFLLDTKGKKIYSFNRRFLPKFKFSYEKSLLVCTYFDTRKYVSFGRWAKCSIGDMEHTIVIKFDMIRNLMVSFIDSSGIYNSADCGSWYDSNNERMQKIYMDDDDEDDKISMEKLEKKTPRKRY